jgi:hypothetical protein
LEGFSETSTIKPCKRAFACSSKADSIAASHAVLSPYWQPAMTGERKKAIQHTINLMGKGLIWGDTLPSFTRDEMHDRE